jgi:hypothetical protein
VLTPRSHSTTSPLQCGLPVNDCVACEFPNDGMCLTLCEAESDGWYPHYPHSNDDVIGEWVSYYDPNFETWTEFVLSGWFCPKHSPTNCETRGCPACNAVDTSSRTSVCNRCEPGWRKMVAELKIGKTYRGARRTNTHLLEYK